DDASLVRVDDVLSPTGTESIEPGRYRLRYQEMFEFASDCHLITDARGIILEANQAAAVLFRRPKEFLVGKPLGLLFSDGTRGMFYQYLAQFGRAGEPVEFESRIGRLPERRDVQVRVVQVDFSRFGLEGFRWQLRDV